VSGPCHFVIFGAAGHLASTKLLPSLYDLEAAGHLDESLGFVALARRDWTTEAWREHLCALIEEHRRAKLDAAMLARFTERFEFVAGDHGDPALYARLVDAVSRPRPGACENLVFYLAVPPDDFARVVSGLGEAGLSSAASRHRIVIEKPFGVDLESAERLNAALHEHYAEEQIFRIDHFLGKETVQNLFVFRFANAVVEPLWNRHNIDHVQITVAEDGGIGSRAGYFDEAGTLRDMMQNHLLQLATLVAMEPPPSLDADALRNEKIKVLQSVRPIDRDRVDEAAVRARYADGEIRGERVRAYRDEPGVADDSTTETYAALKLHIDNWRWRGVPFYLRSGKRLHTQRSQVAIRFRDTPHQIFRETPCEACEPNWLILAIQPDETIRFELQARTPGLDMVPRMLRVDTDYRRDGEERLDAYATLLLDVIEGDRSLFIRFDEVEAAWRVVLPVLERWDADGEGLAEYPAGSWGPDTRRLFEKPHQIWRNHT
jgi:glucose-6-phosphate 1-dehydrogenase